MGKMKLGKVSGNVMKRSVQRQIHTEREEIKDGAGADCAIFALGGTEVVDRDGQDPGAWASCVQESAVEIRGAGCVLKPAVEIGGAGCGKGPAGRAGGTESHEDTVAEYEAACREPVRTMEQLIVKCVNNLAAGGAEAFAVMLAILLPEETEEAELKSLMAEAEEACSRLRLQIAGGQTRVTKAINHPFAVVTGYGKLREESEVRLSRARPGQDIVLSKWIGLEGTAMLARRGREKLLERYPAYLVEEATGFHQYLSVAPEAAIAVKSGVCAMHDASEGGVFAALWELAEAAGVGLTIDLKKLPIRQETVEICEELHVNPYELLSGGCLIMTTEDGMGLVSTLESAGIPAVIVGRLTDSRDRLILNEDEIRYLDRPKQDAIYSFGR